MSDTAQSTSCILLVPAEGETVEVIADALDEEGYRVYRADAALRDAIRKHRPSVLVVHHHAARDELPVMLSDAREADPHVQIILVTDDAEARPDREALRPFEVHGFHDLAEHPDRLLLLVDGARKAYQHLHTIDQQTRALRRVVELSEVIHRAQPSGERYMAALRGLLSLLHSESGLVATSAQHGVLVTRDNDEPPRVRAGLGAYATVGKFDALPARARTRLAAAIGTGDVQGGDDPLVAVPLRLGDKVLGGVLVHTAEPIDALLDQIALFGAQVALAIENSRLYELATVDTVTGLYTRSYFQQRLIEQLKCADRDGSPLSLVLLDLDHFKSINDGHGHVVGDRALGLVGGALRHALRQSDIAARVGGEEFAVLAPNTDTSGAHRLAERIRAAVAEVELLVGAEAVPLTISAGHATLVPHLGAAEHGQLPVPVWERLSRWLLNTADEALYRAKDQGRNRSETAGCSAKISDAFRALVDRLAGPDLSSSYPILST